MRLALSDLGRRAPLDRQTRLDPVRLAALVVRHPRVAETLQGLRRLELALALGVRAVDDDLSVLVGQK